MKAIRKALLLGGVTLGGLGFLGSLPLSQNLAFAVPRSLRTFYSFPTVDQKSGKLCWYLNQATRQNILKQHCDNLEATYAGVHAKKKSIGIDVLDLCEKAVLAEAQFPDISFEAPVEQCEGNLDFFDRVQALGASFQDSHLSMRAAQVRTSVFLPYEFELRKNKVYIARVNPMLVQFAATSETLDEMTKVKVGDEVVEYDGVPAIDAAQALASWVNGSSAAARLEEAVGYLANRKFRIPKTPFARLKIKSTQSKESENVSSPEHVFAIRWLYRVAVRQDDQAVYGQLGRKFASIAHLGFAWNDQTQELEYNVAQSTGYHFEKTFEDLALSGDWYSVDEKTKDTDHVFRSGMITKKGYSFGVLQVFTFDVPRSGTQMVDRQGKQTENKTTSNPFAKTLKTIIAKFNSAGVPVVLDLRKNPGGHLSRVQDLVAPLLPEGTSAPKPIEALPINSYTRGLRDNELVSCTELSRTGPGSYQGDLADLINHGDKEDRPITEWFSDGMVAAPEKGQGFNQKVIVLTGPGCVSACEIAVRTLATVKNVTTFGAPTAGTGFGLWDFDDLNGTWVDSRRVISGIIPTTLFGESYPIDEKIRFGGPELSTENRPFKPSLPYEASVEDLVSNDQGWIDNAIYELSGRKAEFKPAAATSPAQ